MTDWTAPIVRMDIASHRSLVLGHFMTLGWFTASPHREIHNNVKAKSLSLTHPSQRELRVYDQPRRNP